MNSHVPYQRARSFGRRGGQLLRARKAALLQFLLTVVVRRARKSTERRLARGTVRTLWASTPILTLPILAECDRLLGLRSSSLVFNTYYITRSFDINLFVFEAAVRLTRSGLALRNFRRIVLAWALLKFDVFHYFYDRGLMISDGRYGINPEELQLLFDSGKRLYTYAYGADVRSREITLAARRAQYLPGMPSTRAILHLQNGGFELVPEAT